MQSVNTVTHYFDHSITVIQSVEFACIYLLIYNLLSGKILYYFNSRQKGDVVVFLL